MTGPFHLGARRPPLSLMCSCTGTRSGVGVSQLCELGCSTTATAPTAADSEWHAAASSLLKAQALALLVDAACHGHACGHPIVPAGP